ncbi:Gfo/Idh/MocA family oxidoreductase [Desulfonatronovibrio hydrogenovorans]|uniref:Gfo/Idh/MocA family oxidoreductase n=1 Tax=Desulfonatronovibrio hydrogenovorans TaxID=53245 RepID=UPI00048DEE13|nr:Gfo/Idh/MocA family oxidoreductase [Desulfonatronovibrio hydrogenovorans]
MDKLKLGVVGVGHLGKFHARLAAEIEIIDLVGVYDINQDQAAKVCADCNSTPFAELDELLSRVDAVSIVVPTSEHFKVAMAALEQDCHIFIEKPIATSVQEADLIIARAREKNRKIQVGHIERFNPAMLAVKNYNLAPMFIEAHRLSQFNPRGCDVSVVLDLMIHDLDLILYMVNSPVTHIDACGVAVVSDTEDIANVRLKFATGCVANLTSSRISLRSMRRMRLFQKNQYIAMDFMEKKSDVFMLNQDQGQESDGMVVSQIGVGEKARNIVYQKPQVPEVNSLKMELEEFAKAVLLDLAPEVPGEQGRQALEVANTILDKIARP